MNEKILNDLKQFITTTVHQEVGNLEAKINVRFDEIDRHFDENETIQNEILNAIGEVQESQNRAIRRQADVIDNHEHRILKLEKRTA